MTGRARRRPAARKIGWLALRRPLRHAIGIEQARKVLAAVEAEAAKHRWKLNIAVVDTHGELVHFARMDGASSSAWEGTFSAMTSKQLEAIATDALQEVNRMSARAPRAGAEPLALATPTAAAR